MSLHKAEEKFLVQFLRKRCYHHQINTQTSHVAEYRPPGSCATRHGAALIKVRLAILAMSSAHLAAAAVYARYPFQYYTLIYYRF